MPRLTILEDLPRELSTARAGQLADMLGGPTLIHLSGRRPEPLFVSILLHGNEDVGLHAIQQVLARHAGQQLPRALSIFVGNVLAARDGVRRLEGQPDYNRVWPGGDGHGTPEHALMHEVIEQMVARQVFASIDLHSNTGMNPHYACVNRLEYRHLQLASLFSRTVVYFLLPRGVQSRAFSKICPAVTCECGKVGDPAGITHAAEFVSTCLHLAELSDHPVPEGDMHLFHTVARVTVPAGTTFGFWPTDAVLQFAPDLDALNFQELPAGTLIATRPEGSTGALEVISEEGRNVTDEFLTIEADAIRLRKPVMPSMLTLNPEIIRQDCLGYFMERLGGTQRLSANEVS